MADEFLHDVAAEIVAVEAKLAYSSAAYEEGEERRSRIDTAA
jgi:hypothetical protein